MTILFSIRCFDSGYDWKRGLISIFLIFFIFINSAAIVSACSCIPPASPQESLEKSTAVFAGKVQSMEITDGIIISSADPVTVTFDVSTIWKGPDYETLVLTTAREGASCGYSFNIGEDYIVYAFGENDKLSANICTRTKTLANAQEDLQSLGEGKLPTNTGSNIDHKPLTSNTIQILPIGLGIIFLILTIVVIKRRKK